MTAQNRQDHKWRMASRRNDDLGTRLRTVDSSDEALLASGWISHVRLSIIGVLGVELSIHRVRAARSLAAADRLD